MDRPRTPYVSWEWEWRNGESRFHIPHFITDPDERGRGHGSRALDKIVEYAYREHDAERVSIQMGGGAPSARWLDDQSQRFGYMLRVKDVQGYSGDAWQDPDADREDGREDKEGDTMSSVYAEIVDLDYVAYERGWSDDITPE